MVSAVQAVSRIALLSSDALLDLQPPLPARSSFYEAAAVKQHSDPTVLKVPYGADPTASILRQSTAKLISATASADSQTSIRLVTQAAELSQLPVVFHISVQGDLANVLLLRSAYPFFILSTTVQEAHDHALLAAKLSLKERKAVVHAFYSEEADQIDEVAGDKVQPFLLADSRSESPNLSDEGYSSTTGATANGVANGHANGTLNGFADHSIHQDEHNMLFKAYESAASSTDALLRRPSKPFNLEGPDDADFAVFLLGKTHASTQSLHGMSVVSVSLVKPLPADRIISSLLSTATRVVVLEQLRNWSMKWTPLYLDILSAVQQLPANRRPSVYNDFPADAGLESPIAFSHSFKLGIATESIGENVAACAPEPHVPQHELSYTKILSHLFGDRLDVVNAPTLASKQGKIALTPEYALGRVQAQAEERATLVSTVQKLLQEASLPQELHAILSRWALLREDAAKSQSISRELVQALQTATLDTPLVQQVVQLRAHLPAQSKWIIGSDAWSYDLGASGLHHAIASGLNVNVLILDTLPYSQRNLIDHARRKHDVGLYAMNHGDVYVASVAVYSSYAQVLQALIEADKFDGPSVVLAYLPYDKEDAPALEVLKETKLAVDAGYWPLYRWDPSKEAAGKEPFSLDSDAVKNDLKEFLDRQNHLSQLVRSKPELASEIVSNLGDTVKEARRKKAQQSYSEMLTALDAPPLLVLYASDGGAAEKKAKRLTNRAKARGLSVTLATLDSVPLESLASEEYVVLITSTAGQGEPPQNGRQFFKSLNATVTQGGSSQLLSKVRYSVFAMGDSHYWPRPEDAHYYNRPGKDLDMRLEKLGAQRFAEVGLGDDQDADGPDTGYKVWEPLVWKALGVDSIEVTEAEPEAITNEHIKAASRYLRGTIVEGLEDTSTGALAPSDGQLTKFHGIYQQDDRDIRDERQAQGVEPAYSFMIRVRMPGGVCTPEQWLQMDQISDEHGSGTFKITTRQTFQFHGVIKKHLKPAIAGINRALLDTLAACGDVNRNVVCSAIPTKSKLHAQVFEFSKDVSEHLLPRTTAYHEIWLDKKLVAGQALRDFEPLYGEFYLPRKYKIAVAVPPTNDVDVFANDVGFIAIVDKAGDLAGFNVTIGGGMGVTHGNKKTYPRLGNVIGFCTPEQGKHIAEKIMLVQRDNGNRVDRKNARLKYTVDRMGLDVFKAEVEKLLGYTIAPALPYTLDRNVDDYGWATGEDGKHHFTMFVENGRIQDAPGMAFKTGLKEIAKVHKGTFRLTTNQHLLVSDIAPEDLPQIKKILADYKMDNLSQTGLRQSSSACVAFPTCGLAMAESERYLPILIDKVEKICEENGLRDDSIVMRMTGCPNGCARPYVAEIAFVGKAPGTYSMLLGGGYYGQRLNKIYRETVTEPEILAILSPMIKRYALERKDGEHFGDFVIRAGYIAPTTEGKFWYEGMGGEGQYREAVAAA